MRDAGVPPAADIRVRNPIRPCPSPRRRDIVGFTDISQQLKAEGVMSMLDRLCARNHITQQEHSLSFPFLSVACVVASLLFALKRQTNARRRYTVFDALAVKHGLFKVETIGDAFMAVAGIPKHQPDHGAVVLVLCCVVSQADMRWCCAR